MTTSPPKGLQDAALRRSGPFTSLLLTALLILNAALMLALAGRLAPTNTAHAGSAVQGRVAEYLIIPSRPLGMNQDVLYILDTDNARLAVAAYDPTNNRIEFVGPIPLRGQNP